MVDLKKYERLSGAAYRAIRELIVEEGLIDGSEIERIVEQVTKDRFTLGRSKVEFACRPDDNDPEACKVMIASCYYGMYQMSRAAVFHTRRSDVDIHEKVASEIGRILRMDAEQALNFWRNMRNEVDYSPYPALEGDLRELALRAISEATSSFLR